MITLFLNFITEYPSRSRLSDGRYNHHPKLNINTRFLLPIYAYASKSPWNTKIVTHSRHQEPNDSNMSSVNRASSPMSDDPGLWASERRAVLDALDELRSQGVKCLVNEPRIIVCGDQSSGKSSLVSAITGLHLPGKTRFATELVFRRSEEVGVTTRIVPASDRPERQKKALSAFYRYQNYLDIRRPIHDATHFMNLVTAETMYCRDVLRIKITGPTQPHMTLVDLPGLPLSEDRDRSKQVNKDIEDVMFGHMSQEQNFILAVISARRNFAHQQITRHARTFDPNGTRTLGILTKPDTLVAGSEGEQFYVELTQNTANFPLGWHIICNWNYASSKASATERDQAEADFFAKSVWRHHSHYGVPALRISLGKTLYYRTVKNLPRLIGEHESAIKDTEQRLMRLGSPRYTIDEQKRHVFSVGREFFSLIKAAIDGVYTSPFFMGSERGPYSRRRLASVVHNMLSEFAVKMRDEGQAQLIYDGKTSPIDSPRAISQTQYLEEVKALLRQSHGRQLPGTYNPIVVSELFRKQCKP